LHNIDQVTLQRFAVHTVVFFVVVAW